MICEPLAIPEVKLFRPKKWGDDRGFFSEVYKASAYTQSGLAGPFLQDNHSYSAEVGVLRGLHFQAPPHAQGKLVRVARGAVYDVAVDIRIGSPTYGQHVGAVLSAQNWAQLFAPPGFAHGFLTLEPDTEVLYKTTEEYAPQFEGGLAWDDPALRISWPAPARNVAERDRNWPKLGELFSPFRYDG